MLLHFNTILEVEIVHLFSCLYREWGFVQMFERDSNLEIYLFSRINIILIIPNSFTTEPPDVIYFKQFPPQPVIKENCMFAKY